MGKLRFAPIIRVSTEKQKKQGESFETQTKQIIQYVEFLGGVIPDECWKYSGQEHATPGAERKRIDQLLEDSAKGIFDAVIVCDASRWSRDNKKSKEGLEILKANRIKFYVGTTEFDLYEPAQNLFLGMSAEIGEYQAMEQARKSILNRIARAEKGMPTAGRIPYGRTWSKDKGWGVDPVKKKLIEDVARRYLAGEGIPEIAKTLGIPPWNLWKVLTKRSGEEWPVRFKSKRLNINQTVVIKVPRLLEDETIEALKERIRINTTYVRGHRKYHFALSGFIFCRRCGYRMDTYRNDKGQQYYRHPKRQRPCTFHKMVPAHKLENSVLLQLIVTIGDTKLVEEAVMKAYPDLARRESLEKEKKELGERRRELDTEKENLVKAVAKGIFDETDVAKQRREIKSKDDAIIIRINTIENELAQMPTKEHTERAKKLVVGITEAIGKQPQRIFEMDDTWKRQLFERAFSGIDVKGERLGVYVDATDNRGEFNFEIRGSMFSTMSHFPLTDDELLDAFNIDTEYQDVDKELVRIRSNMYSKCDAHNKFCFHQR